MSKSLPLFFGKPCFFAFANLKFSHKHGLKIGTIADLIQYRSERESLTKRQFSQNVTTFWGDFKMFVYKDLIENNNILII